MTKKDLLQRFIFDKVPIRGEYVYLEKAYQTIIQQHQYPSSIRYLLGEALSVVSLLSAIIKFNGRLTLQFRGSGALKLLLAQCDNQFNIRGLARWEGDLTDEHLPEAFAQGVLVMMVNMDNKQNAYQGIVKWQGNSLATSIEGYFRDSEQLATRVWLTVSDQAAAGLLLQVLPGDEKDKINLEIASTDPSWQQIVATTENMNPHVLLNTDAKTLLETLYPEHEIRIFKPNAVQFKCTCSQQRSDEAIYLLGKEEAEAELKTNNSIVVTCEFCNKQYVYDRVDVAKIFADRDHDGHTGKPIH